MSAKGKSIGRNASYNLVGSIVPVLLSFVTVPLYLKLVGPDRYGVLAVAWLLLGYFGLFDLGLGRATSFRMAALRDAPAEDRATTLWTAIVVNLAMGLVGALVLWVAADWFFANIFKVNPGVRAEIVAAVPYLAAAVPVATLTGVLTGALQGREQFLRTNTVSVSSTLLFQIFPLTVAWNWGPYLPRLLLAAIAARVIALIVLWFFCREEVTKGHPLRVDPARFRELLSFAGWVSVTSMFAPILLIADRFLIGAVLGAVAVTLYTVPFQLAQRITMFATALAHALFPRLSAAQPDERRRLGGLALRTLAALVTLPVLVAMLGMGPFLELWVGPEIGSQSAPVGRVVLLGFWINAFAVIHLIRLQSMGRPDLVAKTHAGEAIPYLAGLLAMMHLFGLIGCAIAFVIRCLVEFFILSWLLERRITEKKLFASNFAILLLALALPAWAAPFSTNWFLGSLLLLAITLGSCLYWLPAGIRARIRSGVALFWRSKRI